MFVSGLTSTDKGTIAELKLAAEAARAGVVVSRPLTEGRRYDLLFDVAHRIYRVQCKWGALAEDVIKVRTSTSRYTPTRGYVRTTYSSDEIDLVAVYCGDLDRCYVIPIERLAGQTYLYLRLAPAKNNQRSGVTMASDYELPGAIAQLGERLAGSQKVAGSSPASSTPPKAA